MRLLIDSDAFCKLGIAHLMDEALTVLNCEVGECGRLPALPHMLRRGEFIRKYGVAQCAELIPLAERIPPIPCPDSSWLDRLVGIPDVDPGEIQLYSIAAHGSIPLLTGDKRAIKAIRNVQGFPEALSDRLITLEAIFLALCAHLGDDEIRYRASPILVQDRALRACFSSGNPNPREGLESYLRSLQTEVHPLGLWMPPPGGAI